MSLIFNIISPSFLNMEEYDITEYFTFCSLFSSKQSSSILKLVTSFRKIITSFKEKQSF